MYMQIGVLVDTFKGFKTLVDEIAIVQVAHEATSTSCPEKNVRNGQFLGSIKSEAHGTIRDYASDRRPVVVKLGKKVSKRI